MKQFWDQLTKSQKRILAVGFVFVIGAVILQFAVFPWLDNRMRVKTSIAANEKILRDLKSLGREYSLLRRASEEISMAAAKMPADFALFSYLEKKAEETGLKGHIKAIKPLKTTPTGAYDEIAAEIKLENLTIKQATDFLYHVESPEQMIRIRKMSLGKMKDNPKYLAAEIQVFAYQKATKEDKSR